MYQCLKINFKFRYLKYKISRRRARKKCNVITCIYWNSRTYVSLSRVYALYNNKCIPLTSRNFLLFYLQSFRVYIHLVSVSHRLNAKNKIFFSLVLYFVRFISASITWKTWKTHSVRFHVSCDIDITYIIHYEILVY